MALDKSNHIKDAAQLLFFIRGIHDNFEIAEEFLAMESPKGKTRGEDLYNSMLGVIKRHKLPWSTLANVPTDGLPNVTGTNIRVNPGEGYVMHNPLCKSVLQLDHIVKPVVKLDLSEGTTASRCVYGCLCIT